jgi:hypothetical protein
MSTWHRRLGHLGYDGLQRLVQENLVQDVPRLVDDRTSKVRLQLWAWWVLVYAGFLRCAKVAAVCWGDIEFGWQSGRLVRVQVKLAVAGRKVLKTDSYTGCALAVFSSRWRAVCGEGLGGLEAMARFGFKRGLVFTMKMQEVFVVLKRSVMSKRTSTMYMA